MKRLHRRDLNQVETDPKKMSSWALISNPQTLTDGLNHLQQLVKCHDEESKKGLKREGNRSSARLMNSAPSCPVPNTIAPVDSKETESKKSGRRKKGKKGTRRPKVASGDEENVEQQTSSNGPSPPDNSNISEKPEGTDQFGELMERFVMSESALNKSTLAFEQEFDFEKEGQLMRSVFPDYEAKEHLYRLHETKIKELTPKKATRKFKRIKKDLLDIFEGRLKSTRTDLYMVFLDGSVEAVQQLKSLNVSDPFTNQIFMLIANEIVEFLFPKPKSRLKYGEYMQLVMLPEALIRIYSRVNRVTYDQAETEMKFGPHYDGALDVDLVAKVHKNIATEKRTIESEP